MTTTSAGVADGDVDALLAEHSNWGRWGADDERGTLNLVGPESVRRARDQMRSGGTLLLARAIQPDPSPVQPHPPLHMMIELHGDHDPRARGTASDWLGLACHGMAVTHLDAMCHQSWRGRMYNGRSAASATTRAGIPALGLDSLAAGLFVPAVLLDLPRVLGVDYLEPGFTIGRSLVEQAVELAGVAPRPGDAVVVTTGREARERAVGVSDPLQAGNPGLGIDVGGWLHEVNPSVLVTDVQCDVMHPGGAPHPMPLHVLCLVGLGVHLVDNARLDRLAAQIVARPDGGFALGLAPLLIKRGTGSPLSPLAVL